MLAEVFAWLRPNDLIWNYWVNNYLLGYPPKAFDILYWNADPVRMTAAMHRDFMDLAISNGLTQPGGARMLGTDLDLGKVDTDTYVVAGIADHLCAWESCYQTTQLLGGEPRSSCSPPAATSRRWSTRRATRRRASRRRAATRPTPKEWLDGASKVKGSWWDDYVAVAGRAHGPGAQQAAPPRLGRLRAGLRRPGNLCP